METKQIINSLRDKADRAADLSWARIMHTAADRLKELEEKQRWIPVAERLPELDRNNWSKDVLFCDSEGIIYQGFAFLDSETWKGYGTANRFEKGEVTHWMPLPEPPKEENHA